MKILATETVFTSKNFQIKRNKIERDGKTFTKDFIERNPVVIVIPYNENNEVYLERQFRDARNDYAVELVAGNMDRDNDPLENAKRELKEETGFTAKTWHQLATWDLSVTMSAKIYVFAATDLTAGESALEMDEEIEVLKMPLEKAFESIHNGEITGASHVAALFLFKEMREGGKL